jgi:hypothetical protein
MGLYDGTPTIRIWPKGTKRLLGVCAPRRGYCGDTTEGPPIPANVARLIASTRSDIIWGYFKVCPLTKERAGHMRYVRLAQAKHIFVLHANGK